MKTSRHALVDRLERAGDGQVVLQLNGDHLVGEGFEEPNGSYVSATTSHTIWPSKGGLDGVVCSLSSD